MYLSTRSFPFGGFTMQHTIAAVYDKQIQAEQAIDDPVASGFSRDDVRLSQSEANDQTVRASTGASRDEPPWLWNQIFF
jgi:hypothetical protein